MLAENTTTASPQSYSHGILTLQAGWSGNSEANPTSGTALLL